VFPGEIGFVYIAGKCFYLFQEGVTPVKDMFYQTKIRSITESLGIVYLEKVLRSNPDIL